MADQVRHIKGGKKSYWPESSSVIVNVKRYRINMYQDLKKNGVREQ